MRPRALALAGMMTAAVFVMTRVLVVPIPQTKGFFNLGEAGVYTAAVLYGPAVGALAGGLGSALADLTLGYAQYAPFTLVIKGLEGALVGITAAGLVGGGLAQIAARAIGMFVGGAVMVTGYFVTQAYVFGLGAPVALAELPFNVVQVAAGVVAGLAAAATVGRVLPRLRP